MAAARGRRRAVARHATHGRHLPHLSRALHRHYVPGTWIAHVTIAPRVRLDRTPRVLEAAYEILPLTGTLTRAALVDAGTGEVYPLPGML